MSTSRVASATSVAPQALKNSFPPPNVPVPRLRTGTLNPEPPSCLNSMMDVPWMYAVPLTIAIVSMSERERETAGFPLTIAS
jgi:hypothetical protein